MRLYAALKAGLDSPGVPRTMILVMEYCSGGDLGSKVVRPGLPLEIARTYVAEVLEGMLYLHSRSIMHRDLKPSNILLTRHNHCKITDFGFALVAIEADSVLGTLGYTAPEVQRGSTSPYSSSADIYSWGVILLALLRGDIQSATLQVAVQESVDNPIVAELILQATSYEPVARGTCQELRAHAFFQALDWHELIRSCEDDHRLDLQEASLLEA